VVSSRGEQEAVRAAGAAGATRSLVLFFMMAMAMAGAIAAAGREQQMFQISRPSSDGDLIALFPWLVLGCCSCPQ
jgi:hypothetical protein